MNQQNQTTLLNQVDLLLSQYQSRELQVTFKQNSHYRLLVLSLLIPLILMMILMPPQTDLNLLLNPSTTQKTLLALNLLVIPLWSIIVCFRVVFVYRKNAMQQINREQNLLESLQKLAGNYSITRVTDHLIILDNRPVMQDYLNNLRKKRQNNKPEINAI